MEFNGLAGGPEFNQMVARRLINFWHARVKYEGGDAGKNCSMLGEMLDNQIYDGQLALVTTMVKELSLSGASPDRAAAARSGLSRLIEIDDLETAKDVWGRLSDDPDDIVRSEALIWAGLECPRVDGKAIGTTFVIQRC